MWVVAALIVLLLDFVQMFVLLLRLVLLFHVLRLLLPVVLYSLVPLVLVIVFDFLHFLHQLVLGLGCVLQILHQVLVVAFHAVVVLDKLLKLSLFD